MKNDAGVLRATLALWVFVVIVGGATGSASAQTLTWLGLLDGGTYSIPMGVSADGTVVAGTADWGGITRAFRWTQHEGIHQIPTLGGRDGYGWALSVDGRVIVGDSHHTSGQLRAYRWTQDSGTVDIGQGLVPLGATASRANSVSADGSVIGGYGTVPAGNFACRWASGLIGRLNPITEVRGVSADGSIVVGYETVGGNRQAMRWSDAFGIQLLGTLGGGFSVAFACSADGSVVIGVSYEPGRHLASFRWTAATGMQNLGHLGAPVDRNTSAFALTADGNIVVGRSRIATGSDRAFRWTPSRGIEDLSQTYNDLLSSGVYFIQANAISPDGRYIVGVAHAAGRGGFLLDTWRTGDTNGDGCIDDADLLAVLFAFGSPGTGLTRHEDINKDGIVDDADLLTVLFNFGSGC